VSAYLDLSTLEPIDPPNSRPFADYYESNGQVQTQRFNSPAGIVTATLGSDGKPAGFMVGDPNGDHALFDAQGKYTNSFTPGKGDFWEDFKGNVLEDDKFMTFLAIVAAGAAAGSYAGGAGAAEGVGTGSMSAGDLAAMDAAGGAAAGTGESLGMEAAMAASADAGVGASVAPSVTSTASPGIVDSVAGIPASTPAVTPATTPATSSASSWFTNDPGQAAQYAQMTGSGGGSTLATASDWFSKILGNGQVMGGIISGAGAAYGAHLNSERATERDRENREFQSAELDKERAWRTRNMNVENMPRIRWNREKTEAREKVRSSYEAKPVGQIDRERLYD